MQTNCVTASLGVERSWIMQGRQGSMFQIANLSAKTLCGSESACEHHSSLLVLHFNRHCMLTSTGTVRAPAIVCRYDRSPQRCRAGQCSMPPASRECMGMSVTAETGLSCSSNVLHIEGLLFTYSLLSHARPGLSAQPWKFGAECVLLWQPGWHSTPVSTWGLPPLDAHMQFW